MAKRSGFQDWDKDELREVSSSGGHALWAADKAYKFSRRSAQRASFQRQNMRGREPLPMRKRNGRYEYQIVVDGETRWVSRQTIYLMKQRLAAMK